MLTRAADYAVRVMVHMATLPPGSRVQRTTLAAANDVPESFMSKVLQGLVRARLISSRRGVEGGFELTSDPQQVSLLNVVEAIDGPVRLNVCISSGSGCDRQAECPAHPVWEEAQRAVTRVLEASTIGAMAQQVIAKRKQAEALADITTGGENSAPLQVLDVRQT